MTERPEGMPEACWLCKGACCEQLALPLPPNPRPDEVRWLGYRGTIVNRHLLIEAPCVHLTDGACGIHATKPHPCRIYPVGGEACRRAIAARRSTIAAEILDKL